MAASCDNAIIRDTAESLVVDPLLLEVGRIIMIPADHHDSVVRLGQPPRDLYEDLIIVTGLFKSKTAVTGYDKQRVGHPVLDT